MNLQEYVLVSQTATEVTVFRRANDWKAGKTSGAKVTVPLKSPRLALPLSTIDDDERSGLAVSAGSLSRGARIGFREPLRAA